MKKIICLFLSLILILCASTSVFAQDKININLDSKPQNLISPPIIINDRVYVSIRAISELFGYNVEWQADTKTVNIDTKLEDGEYNIEILDYKRTTDYEGQLAISIRFKFTNNSNETKSYAGSLISCKAFQNGMQLDSTLLGHMNPYNKTEHNQYKEIRPGYSIEVIETFLINNHLLGEVEVEFSEFLSNGLIAKGVEPPNSMLLMNNFVTYK